MTDAELPATDTVVVRDRPLWVRILKWIGIAIVGLLLLVVVLVFALNTGQAAASLSASSTATPPRRG